MVGLQTGFQVAAEEVNWLYEGLFLVAEGSSEVPLS